MKKALYSALSLFFVKGELVAQFSGADAEALKIQVQQTIASASAMDKRAAMTSPYTVIS